MTSACDRLRYTVVTPATGRASAALMRQRCGVPGWGGSYSPRGPQSNARQINFDGRPLAWLARDRHVPAALLDDPMDDRQPEARATFSPSGEERLEKSVHDCGVDAGPRVAQRQYDVRPRSGLRMFAHIRLVQDGVTDLDGEPAALRHGVAGVGHQVENHLFGLAGIGVHRPRLGGHLYGQANSLADRAADRRIEI